MELQDITGRFPEFDAFSETELKAVMVVRAGRSEDAPVEVMLRDIFVWAIVNRASDIHIVARGDRQRPTVGISIRTPKRLVNWSYTGDRGMHFMTKMFQLTATPQGGSTPEILSTRFSMELPERFARARRLQPRDGRPYLVDVRVEYVRTYDNWAFTCRLLDQQRAPKLHELGLNYTLERSIHRALQEPSGLVLVSGPTGSGKTTLLNAMIDTLNDGQRSIVTIENPVEFRLEGEGPIKQIQVGGDITFARALRSVLRHDPDVILIGEIRDQETMEIALQGSQTGHLVMATLHANSAPETISRALDLTLDKNRDAYRLAETVRLVMAQRLMDRFDGVAQERQVTHDEAAWLSTNGMGFVESIAEVTQHAKIGKAALIEAIAMSPAIKDAIRADRLSVSEIYRSACDQPQYETLANAGIRAVQGLGCRVRDCMTRLESTSDAMTFPGLRSRLARDHALTLGEVAHVVDEMARAEDANRDVSIDELAEVVKAQKRELQCASH